MWNKQMKHDNTALRFLTRAGIIGALYAALTLVIYPLSFGALQFRVSEAMCVLPVFFPEAVPGLFIGCAVANLMTPNIPVLDIVFGSLATLLSALVTSRLSFKSTLKTSLLAPLPPVIFNALIVGAVITLSLTEVEGGFWELYALNALSVGGGEAVVCYALGVPLILVMKKLSPRLSARSDLQE